MNIAVAYHRHGWDRGIERKSAELSERFARSGHEVDYICGLAEPRAGSAVSLVKVPVRGGPTSLVLGAFDLFARRALRRRDYDLSISFGSVVGCDLLVAESCHRAGMDARSAHPEIFGDERRNLGIADSVRLLIEKSNYARGNYIHIAACSRRVRRELEHYYGVPESDVTVIPSGVDLEQFGVSADRQALRRELGYTDRDFLLLFVGNEFGRKGLGTVLRSLTRPGLEAMRLLVCGDGPVLQYRKLTLELGVGDRVRFEGHVRDVARYFGAADAFVFPTIHEAFGLVILEAMAAGLPTIVSAAAGAAEDHMADGEEGVFLKNPTDHEELARSILSVAERPDRGRTFGEAGRRRASGLSWDRCASEFLRILPEVRERKASAEARKGG